MGLVSVLHRIRGKLWQPYMSAPTGELRVYNRAGECVFAWDFDADAPVPLEESPRSANTPAP